MSKDIIPMGNNIDIDLSETVYVRSRAYVVGHCCYCSYRSMSLLKYTNELSGKSAIDYDEPPEWIRCTYPNERDANCHKKINKHEDYPFITLEIIAQCKLLNRAKLEAYIV